MDNEFLNFWSISSVLLSTFLSILFTFKAAVSHLISQAKKTLKIQPFTNNADFDQSNKDTYTSKLSSSLVDLLILTPFDITSKVFF